jgi:hypothetical protein
MRPSEVAAGRIIAPYTTGGASPTTVSPTMTVSTPFYHPGGVFQSRPVPHGWYSAPWWSEALRTGAWSTEEIAAFEALFGNGVNTSMFHSGFSLGLDHAAAAGWSNLAADASVAGAGPVGSGSTSGTAGHVVDDGSAYGMFSAPTPGIAGAGMTGWSAGDMAGWPGTSDGSGWSGTGGPVGTAASWDWAGSWDSSSGSPSDSSGGSSSGSSSPDWSSNSSTGSSSSDWGGSSSSDWSGGSSSDSGGISF